MTFWRGKGYFRITTPSPRNRGQELKAGTNRSHGGTCLTGSLFPLAQFAFHKLQDQLRRTGMPIVGWDLPHQSPIRKKPYRLASKSLLQRHFVSRGFLFSHDLCLFRLTRNLSQDKVIDTN